MKAKLITGLAAAILISFSATPAMAQVSEVRIGISEFDERTLKIPLSAQRASENSAAVNFEILFGTPKHLKWALSPKPYVGGTLNLEGKTSFGGTGLLWRQRVNEKFYCDFAFGLVVHTGTKDIRLGRPISEAEWVNGQGQARVDLFNGRFDSEIKFGSRVLFREQIALGYSIGDDWSGELFLEHLSNAMLLSSQRNDGANNLGFRAVRKF